MESTVQTRVLQLLSGVDTTFSEQRPKLAWMRSDVPADDLQKYTVLFSGTPLQQPYIQLLGDLGTEGDEAVFADGLIVETCSISGLPYIDILGPTYVSFETGIDEEILRDILCEFGRHGRLPASLHDKALVFELAGFAPDAYDVERSIVTELGEEPWPIPDAIVKIREEFPKLSSQFASAMIMIRRMKDTGSEFVFDLPRHTGKELDNLLLARDVSNYRCMNVHTGQIFSLGYDMYRAVLSRIDPHRLAELPGAELDDEVCEEAFADLREIVQI
ncbi:hypothetical protein [Actinomyces sp. S4-C9]|uniref:hypothetical protein n=1 Tax=Actinomyces sp. S4-C9 TaxID=1219581 RepID=UPI00050E1768|nr:hypothetical protein [Actinomyces sp. S4-C9]KGF02589.1 hypothetical protein HMPREF1628_01495 [Actinomyces sp. S4-C9]